MADEIMTLHAVAEYLHIGPAKLYSLAQEGKIPATKIGRTWRFRKDLVDLWFAEMITQNITRHQSQEADSAEQAER